MLSFPLPSGRRFGVLEVQVARYPLSLSAFKPLDRAGAGDARRRPRQTAELTVF
jgi:hypothetical protein